MPTDVAGFDGDEFDITGVLPSDVAPSMKLNWPADALSEAYILQPNFRRTFIADGSVIARLMLVNAVAVAPMLPCAVPELFRTNPSVCVT